MTQQRTGSAKRMVEQARLTAQEIPTSTQKKSHGHILRYRDPHLRITLDTFSNAVEVHDQDGRRVLWARGGLDDTMLEFQPGGWTEHLEGPAGIARERRTRRRTGKAT